MDMMNGKDKMRCRGMMHTVESGDTLYRISRKYDVRLSEIMKANPYINVYNLQIGDTICVPTSQTAPPPVMRPEPPRERTYTVEAGDTIADVLRYFDEDFEDIAEYNEDIANLPLQPGLVIRMPIDFDD